MIGANANEWSASLKTIVLKRNTWNDCLVLWELSCTKKKCFVTHSFQTLRSPMHDLFLISVAFCFVVGECTLNNIWASKAQLQSALTEDRFDCTLINSSSLCRTLSPPQWLLNLNRWLHLDRIACSLPSTVTRGTSDLYAWQVSHTAPGSVHLLAYFCKS